MSHQISRARSQAHPWLQALSASSMLPMSNGKDCWSISKWQILHRSWEGLHHYMMTHGAWWWWYIGWLMKMDDGDSWSFNFLNAGFEARERQQRCSDATATATTAFVRIWQACSWCWTGKAYPIITCIIWWLSIILPLFEPLFLPFACWHFEWMSIGMIPFCALTLSSFACLVKCMVCSDVGWSLWSAGDRACASTRHPTTHAQITRCRPTSRIQIKETTGLKYNNECIVGFINYHTCEQDANSFQRCTPRFRWELLDWKNVLWMSRKHEGWRLFC